MNKEIKAKIEELKENTLLNDHLDFVYLENDNPSEGFDSLDELQEYLQERIIEAEIIYYHTAMEFLMKHDASLRESITLASEYGCTLDSLNSELLATVLLQDMLSQELASEF